MPILQPPQETGNGNHSEKDGAIDHCSNIHYGNVACTNVQGLLPARLCGLGGYL